MSGHSAIEISFDDPEAAYAMSKIVLKHTGLPMLVWITPNEGYPHGCRVKVARSHGARGRFTDSATITVPDLQLVGHLDGEDYRRAAAWIALNQAVILDFWNGVIDDIGDVLPKLQKLP